MELSITEPKDKDRGKLLDGSGVALEATIPDPTIRTGADQEIVHLLDHVSLLEMIMLWTLPLLFAKPQTTKNKRNTKRPADVSNVENKVISFATVPIKRHMLKPLALFKSKRMTNRSPPKPPPHLYLSLCK